jgi:hypothetical protein
LKILIGPSKNASILRAKIGAAQQKFRKLLFESIG